MATLALGAVLWCAFATGILYVSTFDVGVYREYGEAIVGGAVPYRDIAIEYPPGSLALFVPPALVTEDSHSYRVVFSGAMLLAAGLTLAGMRRLERKVIGSRSVIPVPLFAAFGLVAVVGSVAITRFDLVPAVLTVGALLALTADRRLVAAAALGAAIAVKLYPLVLLPVVFTYVARRGGRRAAVSVAALALSVVAIAYAPFLVWSPAGVLKSLDAQLLRSLQIESLPGSLFGAAHHLLGIAFVRQTTYYDFSGRAAEIAATTSVAVGIAVLIALWIAQIRAPPTPRSLVRYSAAVLTTFVAFGKVLSPQYMLWLIPLVCLVAGTRGRVALALLAVACLLTAAVFPRHFNALQYDVAAKPLAVIVVRDLVLVAMVAVLGWPRRPGNRRAAGLSSAESEPAQAATPTSSGK